MIRSFPRFQCVHLLIVCIALMHGQFSVVAFCQNDKTFDVEFIDNFDQNVTKWFQRNASYSQNSVLSGDLIGEFVARLDPMAVLLSEEDVAGLQGEAPPSNRDKTRMLNQLTGLAKARLAEISQTQAGSDAELTQRELRKLIQQIRENRKSRPKTVDELANNRLAFRQVCGYVRKSADLNENTGGIESRFSKPRCRRLLYDCVSELLPNKFGVWENSPSFSLLTTGVSLEDGYVGQRIVNPWGLRPVRGQRIALDQADELVAVIRSNGQWVETIGMHPILVYSFMTGTIGKQITLVTMSTETGRLKRITLEFVQDSKPPFSRTYSSSDIPSLGDLKIEYFRFESDVSSKFLKEFTVLLSDCSTRVDGGVFDFRSCRSGAMRAAADTLSLLKDDASLVIKRNSSGVVEDVDGRKDRVWKKPMVVLANHGTGRVFEQLVASLQELDNVIVVGSHLQKSGIIHASYEVSNSTELSGILVAVPWIKLFYRNQPISELTFSPDINVVDSTLQKVIQEPCLANILRKHKFRIDQQDSPFQFYEAFNDEDGSPTASTVEVISIAIDFLKARQHKGLTDSVP